MSRFVTFAVFGLVLAVLCFGGWKVLHLTRSANNDLPSVVQSALSHPSSLEVATIAKSGGAGRRFGGYSVITSADVPTAELRQQTVTTLLSCISSVGQGSECFDPTLAIHLTSPEGDFVFLPCFKCGHMKVVQMLPGRAEEWSWVEIRATGGEFGPLLQALHLVERDLRAR